MLLQNKHIFILEDNLENRAIMQILLEQQGAKTAIDRWGVDTVNRLRKFLPVDVILLDLMLPNGISGFDVFDHIRAEVEFMKIPIVAVSAMDTSVAVPKAREKGFAGFISKPIDYDSFAICIARVIQGEFVWKVT